jgi:hypothetical protein
MDQNSASRNVTTLYKSQLAERIGSRARAASHQRRQGGGLAEDRLGMSISRPGPGLGGVLSSEGDPQHGFSRSRAREDQDLFH